MTQNEFQQLVSQINEAFKDQFNRLETLEEKVKALEGKLNEQCQKGLKAGTSRSKRVQQAEADS
jgi:transposase